MNSFNSKKIKCYFCKKIFDNNGNNIANGCIFIETKRLDIPYCNDCFDNFVNLNDMLVKSFVFINELSKAQEVTNKIREEIRNDLEDANKEI